MSEYFAGKGKLFIGGEAVEGQLIDFAFSPDNIDIPEGDLEFPLHSEASFQFELDEDTAAELIQNFVDAEVLDVLDSTFIE